MVKRTKRYTFSPVSDVDVEESMFLSPVFNFSFLRLKLGSHKTINGDIEQ